MSEKLGENFDQSEKEFLTFPSVEFDEALNSAFPSSTTGTANESDLSSSTEETSFTPGFISVGGDSNEKQSSTYKDPLSKIGGGGVLQYPIDLDTDLQDYFEIQIFKYRPAASLPDITSTNQGSNYDKDGNELQPKLAGGSFSQGYFANSNRRGNRQNFRLQDLQSTIQLPIPPSVKDMNSVGFGGERMSGFANAVAGPLVTAFFKENSVTDEQERSIRQKIKEGGMDLIGAIKDVVIGTGKIGLDLLQNDQFVRLQSLRSIAQATARFGVNIDIDQAITRVSGAIRNPNLELLFNGPSLRSFSFTIRFTPRDEDEAKRVRMIIRALKQHSVVKKNPNVLNQSGASNNFLLGTPDVFKLRYIKARTQKDIKGLNKFKTCALTDISVDYTGEVGRFAAYEVDSQPITSLISLSFTELAPLYDEDYAEFTADDDVGL